MKGELNMDFKELLDAFAADVGMTDPVAYEDDTCHLDIDDRDYGFRYVAELGRMVIWTAVCRRPPDSGEALLIQLLRANFMNQGIPSGALSLSDDDVIYAHCTLQLPVHEKGDFYRLLNRFVGVVNEWRTMIELSAQAGEVLKSARKDEPLNLGKMPGVGDEGVVWG